MVFPNRLFTFFNRFLQSLSATTALLSSFLPYPFPALSCPMSPKNLFLILCFLTYLLSTLSIFLLLLQNICMLMISLCPSPVKIYLRRVDNKSGSTVYCRLGCLQYSPYEPYQINLYCCELFLSDIFNPLMYSNPLM